MLYKRLFHKYVYTSFAQTITPAIFLSPDVTDINLLAEIMSDMTDKLSNILNSQTYETYLNLRKFMLLFVIHYPMVRYGIVYFLTDFL